MMRGNLREWGEVIMLTQNVVFLLSLPFLYQPRAAKLVAQARASLDKNVCDEFGVRR